jgi:hypothetical protein
VAVARHLRCLWTPSVLLSMRSSRSGGTKVFRCAVTGKLTAPGEECRKVIITTRPVTYTNYVPNMDGDTWHNGQRCRVVISKGWEIVKEVNVSPEGLEVLALKAKGVQ